MCNLIANLGLVCIILGYFRDYFKLSFMMIIIEVGNLDVNLEDFLNYFS